MISIGDFYAVLAAMVPLYVAMFLAYGSVRWWKIFTPVQCSGINRFVAVFAVPLLSFHFISNNNPYKMDGPFILADTVSKIAVFITLMVWVRFSRSGSLDWLITLFSLATLPNTLVMGIPLLEAMYGHFYAGLMVQVVVLQCIIWYTLMLFLFEYRAATLLVREQFPDTAASIISFKVDSDVISLDGREPLETVADIGEDGKLRVTIRKSISSCSQAYSSFASPRRSVGLLSMPSSKAMTPRASNLTGGDIYSIQTGRSHTPVSPRQSNFTISDSLHSSRGPTPRASNVNEDNYKEVSAGARGFNSPRLPQPFGSYSFNMKTQVPAGWNGYSGMNAGKISPKCPLTPKGLPDLRISPKMEDEGKDLHMFVWSSTASPVSEPGLNAYSKRANDHTEARMLVVSPADQTPNSGLVREQFGPTLASPVGKHFTFGNRRPGDIESPVDKQKQSMSKSCTENPSPKDARKGEPKDLPPTTVMLKLILKMVGRKLLRNPNTYSSLLGLIWSLISFRWNINMPTIVTGSIKILSDAGLGMAMFSLGLFMALQPRLIACGTTLAAFAMAVRFLTGPAVMAASSLAVGLRKVDLHAAIVQAALPQGIVPFVFAREYDLHPDILSTAVIFGMLIALPITLLYYILLGL